MKQVFAPPPAPKRDQLAAFSAPSYGVFRQSGENGSVESWSRPFSATWRPRRVGPAEMKHRNAAPGAQTGHSGRPPRRKATRVRARRTGRAPTADRSNRAPVHGARVRPGAGARRIRRQTGIFAYGSYSVTVYLPTESRALPAPHGRSSHCCQFLRKSGTIFFTGRIVILMSLNCEFIHSKCHFSAI